MSHTQGTVIARHLRRLVAVQCLSQQSDPQLLRQYLADRDEAAFAVLVQRHGAMVLEVSRSVLRHRQDAEDVFQAAFLILARKAHTVRKPEALGSWLHGVAYRLALKAKGQAGRRRDREQTTATPTAVETMDDLTVRELRVILHDEVHRLAEHYRAALLLCYWEGKTRDEAAGQLGMSPGAFKKCLERARNLLGSRLMRRGLAPSSAGCALLLTGHGTAALASVVTKTAARAVAAGVTGNSAGVSAAAAALAEGVMHTMNLTKWATTILTLLLLSGLGTGLGLGAYHLLHASPGDSRGQDAADQAVQVPQGKGKKPGKPDKERIVGVWRFTKGVANGEDLPAEFTALARVTFSKDGAMVMTVVEETKRSKYDLVGPGKIDFRNGMNDPAVSQAIYKFDGNDRLTLCVSNDVKARPTEFESVKGGANILFVLARARPGEEKPTADEIAKFKGGVDKVREAAARAQSTNNLKQIGLAVHNFAAVHNSLPAHAIYSKDGKTPLLSWRVAILPYLEQAKLYEEFKLDEPWDSPHNKKLLPKMPKIYVVPAALKAKEGETHYQVVTGPDTLFDGAKNMKFTDITDGTSNTLLVVEAKTAVVWTRPDDLTLPKEKDKRPPVGGLFTGGFHVLRCDGSVQFMAQTVPVATLRALITPAAGD